jgi:lysylphosphatidylglycerol synthetase-like protein (DUF2156 family)
MKTAAKKSKKKKNRSFSIATIAESFLSLLMIPVGLAAVKGIDGTENTMDLLAFLVMAEFLLLSITTFLRATARRYRNQIPERRRLDFIFSGLFLACAVAIFIEPSLTVMMIAGIVFMLSLIPSRVLSILRNRRWFNIVLNVAFILLVIFSIIDLWSEEESQLLFVIVVMLLIAFRSLLRIMSVTFARLRLDLLRDIVQKTYAAEIIFGLLLLIASFSFVLLYTDAASFDGKYTNALWYCFAVVTTIGFGDMTAVSSIGRVLSVILGIYGIIVVALITSIIVNFYGEMKSVDDDNDDK